MMPGCGHDAGAEQVAEHIKCQQTGVGDADMSLMSAHFLKPLVDVR